MDVKLLASRAAILTMVACTGFSGRSTASEIVSGAREPDERMRTIAPTVTQASFSISDGGAGACDCGNYDCSACDAGGCCDTGANACDAGCPLGSCDSGCSLGSCGFQDLFGGLLDEILGGNVIDSTCGEDGLLGFGIVKKSEPCFQDFISPMTNPLFFEDPRNLTELRFLFINHELPAALGGNSVQVYAMQLRARLTDRLSLIATKDGFIYTQSPVLDSGYADLSAGLKYNLYRNPKKGWLMSCGFTYEAPTGSNRSLQGNGSGEWNFFATGGARMGERWHVVSALGLRQPNDENLENGTVYRSVHIDRRMGDRMLYLFTEFNWFNYLNSGNAFPLPLEGGDLFNFGSPNITGNDLITNAIGVRAKPSKSISTGVAWEYPMTKRKGILDNRVTADLIFRY